MTLSDILSNQRWRLDNLYTIKDAYGKILPFRMREGQRWFMRRIWHRNLILKARKRGFSTLVELLGADRLAFNPNQTMALIDKTLPDAKQKLGMIRLAWDTVGLNTPNLSPSDAHDLNRLLHQTNPVVKSSETILEWKNGSRVECSVSSRGGSPNVVHISEMGPIAYKDPLRANEIKTGALESVQTGGQNLIFLESTHMGGKFGLHYQMIKEAQEAEARGELTELDYKFHFFAWWMDKDQSLPVPNGQLILPPEHAQYFRELDRAHGIRLSDGQKLWWSKKKAALGHDMGSEHPSTVAEAVEAPTAGAIYAYLLADLRSKGRVGASFEIDRRYPVWTFWDLGRSDYTAIWAVQLAGQDILWLDWYEANNQAPSHYAEVMREWESRYPIAGHFLPHDATQVTFAGPTAKDHLAQAGLRNLIVNPRCADIWTGVNELRELLRRSVFHQRCCTPRKLNGEEFPSGLDHLEAYHKHVAEAGSTLKEQPVHDQHSHTADAARTFAEAFAAGKVLSHFPVPLRDRKPQRAILG